jgi:hypothetical protein
LPSAVHLDTAQSADISAKLNASLGERFIEASNIIKNR